MTQKAEIQFVLLRGLARESRHWGAFPQLLEEAFAKQGIKVLVDAIDLPGTGRYSEMRSPISIGAIQDFARNKFVENRRKMREQGILPPKKTFLIAVSLGGMVAREWMSRHPSDITGAVLINTSFKSFSPAWKRLLPTAVKRIAFIARESEAIARERLVLEMISNREDIRDETARAWGAIHLNRPVSPENFARQLLAAALYTPSDREAPSHATLVLSSKKDRMVDPSCSTVIAKKWNAEIRHHETAGHDLPLDDAPWVVDQVVDWCTKNAVVEAASDSINLSANS